MRGLVVVCDAGGITVRCGGTGSDALGGGGDRIVASEVQGVGSYFCLAFPWPLLVGPLEEGFFLI